MFSIIYSPKCSAINVFLDGPFFFSLSRFTLYFDDDTVWEELLSF